MAADKKTRIKSGESSCAHLNLDNLMGTPPVPLHGVIKPDIHSLSIAQAKEFEKHWVEFKTNFDDLIELSLKAITLSDMGRMIRKIEHLRKYMLINFETFDIKTDHPFKDRLGKMIHECHTLQIVFGMKNIDPGISEVDPELFAGKHLMSCVMLIGRNEKGDIIEKL